MGEHKISVGNHDAKQRKPRRKAEETMTQSRVVSSLSSVLPTSQMFTSGYVNMETILRFFDKITNERWTKTVFTYAHVKWFYGQSERAYYLNYFITSIKTILYNSKMYENLFEFIFFSVKNLLKKFMRSFLRLCVNYPKYVLQNDYNHFKWCDNFFF